MPYMKVSEKHSISMTAIFDRKGNAAFATKEGGGGALVHLHILTQMSEAHISVWP